MKQRKQINHCKIVGDESRAIVKTENGKIVEDFNNATADKLATVMQPNAFLRACQWVRDSITVEGR